LTRALQWLAGWLGSVDEDEAEEDFSYRRDAGNGPARWGLIRREWAACSVGLQQSPMGLSDTVAGLADRPGRLGRSYRPAAASLVNRGHDIMVRMHAGPCPAAIVVDRGHDLHACSIR
jgi:carbonic anhydrase